VPRLSRDHWYENFKQRNHTKFEILAKSCAREADDSELLARWHVRPLQLSGDARHLLVDILGARRVRAVAADTLDTADTADAADATRTADTADAARLHHYRQERAGTHTEERPPRGESAAEHNRLTMQPHTERVRRTVSV
jgi:hypothetical protein